MSFFLESEVSPKIQAELRARKHKGVENRENNSGIRMLNEGIDTIYTKGSLTIPKKEGGVH